MEAPVSNLDPRATARRRISVPVKILALFHIALALAGLVAGAILCVSFWLVPGRFSNTILAFAIPIFLFFAIFLLLPGLAGGIALLLGKAWGRIVIFLLSGLMLFIVPVGTLVGGFGIWALLGDRAPAGTGIRREAAGGGPPATTGSYIAATLLLLVAVGAAGVIVLAIVFRFQEQDPPPAVHDLLPGATIALPGGLILAALTIGIARCRRRQRSPAVGNATMPAEGSGEMRILRRPRERAHRARLGLASCRQYDMGGFAEE